MFSEPQDAQRAPPTVTTTALRSRTARRSGKLLIIYSQGCFWVHVEMWGNLRSIMNRSCFSSSVAGWRNSWKRTGRKTNLKKATWEFHPWKCTQVDLNYNLSQKHSDLVSFNKFLKHSGKIAAQLKQHMTATQLPCPNWTNIAVSLTPASQCFYSQMRGEDLPKGARSFSKKTFCFTKKEKVINNEKTRQPTWTRNHCIFQCITLKTRIKYNKS